MKQNRMNNCVRVTCAIYILYGVGTLYYTIHYIYILYAYIVYMYYTMYG
eukprot:COSAG03_NODE_11307_length_600_cov_0.998004_2_plen_48_part_01